MAATVWSGYISFGLVSFPVKLYSAARAETVHFHMLHRKDLSRVKEVFYCSEENKHIERSEIVKGYEASKGNYVVVDDEDLNKIAPATAATMDIVQFVKNDEVDPIYFERSYYVGSAENAGKPFSLFLKALTETRHSAIAKLTMHARENVVLIRSTGEELLLHTLFYPDELQAGNKAAVPPKATATRKEIELATSLIRQLAAPFKPEKFEDTYREQVEKLIEQKKKGQKIAATPTPRRAPVIDLMEALKKSIQSNKNSRRRKVA
jgi:DNA end-binding protein Ku